MPHPTRSHPHRPRRAVAASVLTAATLLLASACGSSTAATPASGAAGGPAPAAAAVGAPAPGGTFTTLDGTTLDVASLRGKPTVLWFVAAGCSSCTASIPAVADHLQQLHNAGVQVAVIDLYGDLGSGTQGAQDLRTLGTSLVGARLTDPGWTWGTSSKDLSFSYDASGQPDVYYVLDRTGTITYTDGVPVSTMDQLLSHALTAAKT
jgi:hypothetical protein